MDTYSKEDSQVQHLMMGVALGGGDYTYSLGAFMSSDPKEYRKCFQPRWWFSAEGEPSPFIDEEDMLMWVYKRVGDTFQVGYFGPDGQWFADGDFSTKEAAAARVRYLNGGNESK